MGSEERSADAGNQAPPWGACGKARLLLNEYGDAVKNAAQLYREQLQAIVKGDLEAHRFDLLIHNAIENKLEAKYAYLAHVQLHGCSNTRDEQIDTRRTGTNS